MGLRLVAVGRDPCSGGNAPRVRDESLLTVKREPLDFSRARTDVSQDFWGWEGRGSWLRGPAPKGSAALGARGLERQLGRAGQPRLASRTQRDHMGAHGVETAEAAPSGEAQARHPPSGDGGNTLRGGPASGLMERTHHFSCASLLSWYMLSNLSSAVWGRRWPQGSQVPLRRSEGAPSALWAPPEEARSQNPMQHRMLSSRGIARAERSAP